MQARARRRLICLRAAASIGLWLELPAGLCIPAQFRFFRAELFTSVPFVIIRWQEKVRIEPDL
jgi:hypothetical protein